ncbi:MAG: hypothetical protein Q7T56_17755 [Nocardioidaceae bacterium]|nr:hypothetical protein [Nocardioidaceae bacterium]
MRAVLGVVASLVVATTGCGLGGHGVGDSQTLDGVVYTLRDADCTRLPARGDEPASQTCTVGVTVRNEDEADGYAFGPRESAVWSGDDHVRSAGNTFADGSSDVGVDLGETREAVVTLTVPPDFDVEQVGFGQRDTEQVRFDVPDVYR